MLEDLFDKKVLTVIKYFLRNPTQEFYLKEVAKSNKLPLASVFRMLNKLTLLEILKMRKIKAFKLYSWNDNEKTRYLQYILEQKKTVLDGFVEEASKIRGVLVIVLHGEVSKSHANLLIIGSGVDDAALRNLVVAVKTENDFTITHLNLTPEQFNQMSAMGLYPKTKTILYEKKS